MSENVLKICFVEEVLVLYRYRLLREKVFSYEMFLFLFYQCCNIIDWEFMTCYKFSLAGRQYLDGKKRLQECSLNP